MADDLVPVSPAPVSPTPVPAAAVLPGSPTRTPPGPAARGLDLVMSVQRPVVLAHIRSIRSRRPDATPAQVVAILERRYLTAVTTGGALVGASSAIPAVGVGAALVLSGVETAGFLEASALFAQSVCEVHGIPVDDPERARTLVMAMMLGSGGADLVRQFAGQAAGGATRSAFWGEMVTSSLPRTLVGPLADRVQRTFLRRFAASQGGSIAGRLVPFGIGAVLGGSGNHLLGRRVVAASREAFGPAPATFPATLDVVPKPPKAPKVPRAPKAPKAATPRRPRRLRGRPEFPALPPARPEE